MMRLRHVALFLEAFQFLDEAVGPLDVGIIQVVAAEPRIEVAFQRLDRGRGRVLGRLAVVDPLAVTAIADLGLGAAVPDVAAGRAGDLVEIALGRDKCSSSWSDCRDS